ncbi:membrane-associating domain-containing protein [Chaetomidium leptoderma]|uniref:Membrane-associating domain-containing protein n=1 Tax=Chaetomidium leptoderma TaxID=669021 RepID=A0AAN6ZVC7_9PEZI|nr:membrane-associating domain-containing protein [Chaetomidium leptoderma]
MERFVPIVHAVTAVFAVIELGLTAYLVSPWHWGTPSILAFMLFNSVWSLLVLAYLFLTPLYYARFFHGIVALAIEWITMIFWFAGSIALATYSGSSRCDGNTYCGSVQAAIAFGFFLWALFGFLVVVDTLAFLRGRGHHTAQPKPHVGV